MEVKNIKIKDLKFHPSNPRRIKKDQMEKLCRSIESDPEFLNCRPVLVNNDGASLTIYAGNQRVRAAKKLGMKEIACIVDIDLHEDIMKKRMIQDNKTYGEFDFDILANEYEIDFLIECGFNAEELIGEFEDKASKEKEAKEKKCPHCGKDL